MSLAAPILEEDISRIEFKLMAADEFDKVESYWSVSNDSVVEEGEEILTAKKSFLPTPPDTPPPYPALALEEDDEIIMQT